MKTIGVMQPYLFPYIGYFQLLNAVDEYIVYDDVNYIKGGWINRNNLLIEGKKNLFTIRLTNASSNKLINEIDIQDDFIKFLKTVSMTYLKSPYYDQVIELIYSICRYEDRNLARFIGNSLRAIAEYIGINTEIIYSSDIEKNNKLKGQNKILDICKCRGADRYINAIGGQGLYSHQVFNEHNITLNFLKTNTIEYKQGSGEFVPGLSIIDVLMFNSPEEVRVMLGDYELV